MQEEEAKILNSTSEDLPSVVLRRKQQDGSLWFYHIMHEAYNGPNNVPYSRLRASVPDFDELSAAVSKTDTEAFVQMKLKHLERYEEELAETERRHPDFV